MKTITEMLAEREAESRTPNFAQKARFVIFVGVLALVLWGGNYV